MAQHSDGTTAADLARLVPAGGIVGAVTDDGDDPRHAAVRDAAADVAVAATARILLYYAALGPPGRGPTRSRIFSPATVDAADGAAARLHTGSRRRDLLGAEVAAIRARGVDVAVWLPGRPGNSAVAEAVALTHAAIVLMPAEAARPRVVRRTLDYRATKIAAPVVAVDPAGRLTRIRPLGGDQADDGAEGAELALRTAAALTAAP